MTKRKAMRTGGKEILLRRSEKKKEEHIGGRLRQLCTEGGRIFLAGGRNGIEVTKKEKGREGRDVLLLGSKKEERAGRAELIKRRGRHVFIDGKEKG